jgi:UvrD-like helicase C-terminal domain/Nuclease-related domain/AAA domain
MPAMIPNAIDPNAPTSERRVFDLLKCIPDSQQWIVLHSLGLSNSYSGEYGEVDFVVIIPDSGIVCLEVKGGGVSCTNGIWSTVDQHGARHDYKRSPFAQVREGMWKLVSAIRTHFGENSPEAGCAIGWTVVFPDITSPPPTTEFRRDEVIDRNDLQGDWKARLMNTPSLLAAQRNRGKPSRSTCERLLKFLRPDFERIGTVSSDLWDTEERIRSLTEEQYAFLDALAANRTCLVYGPAGTGKTLLAVEAAKRSASNGHPTLLTCFNRNLGRWLSRSVEGVQLTSLASGNLHKILRDRILRSSIADEFLRLEARAESRFFSEDYYELGALAIAEIGERFGTVLIDEVQDFPMKGLAQVVKEWTGGHPAHIMLFGDFAHQAIYDASTRLRDQVTAAFPGLTSFALSLNCRNTRMIAKQIELVAGSYGGRISERQPEGHTVEYFYHSGDEEQITHLEQVGMTLRRQGYKPEDIIILSPTRFETGPLARLSRLANWPVNDFENAGPQEIARSTIHAFKGLERSVVILADIDTRDAAEADNLLYVGMSRARTRLFLLCSKTTQGLINERIISNLKLSPASA